MKKPKRNHEREARIPRYRTLLIFINFNFLFLTSYKMYFQNYSEIDKKKIGDFHKPSADATRLLMFNIVLNNKLDNCRTHASMLPEYCFVAINQV